MQLKILITLLAIVAIAMLGCGASDEPPAANPGATSPAAAQTTDAITPARSGEIAGETGETASAETPGASPPGTNNSSMPSMTNPAAGSQAPLTVSPNDSTQSAMPVSPPTEPQDSLSVNTATEPQGTVPGLPTGQQQTTRNSNTATNAGSVPAATLPPTPIPCEALAGAMWLTEDFWMNADPTQVTAALDCGATVLASNISGVMSLHLAA